MISDVMDQIDRKLFMPSPELHTNTITAALYQTSIDSDSRDGFLGPMDISKMTSDDLEDIYSGRDLQVNPPVADPEYPTGYFEDLNHPEMFNPLVHDHNASPTPDSYVSERAVSSSVGDRPKISAQIDHDVTPGVTGSTRARGSQKDRSKRITHHMDGGESSKVAGDRAGSKHHADFINIFSQPVRDVKPSENNTPQELKASAHNPILTDHQFEILAQQPYDPLWIENLALDRVKLAIPPSPLKIQKLFMDNILVVGDKFILGDVDEGIKQDLRNEAEVSDSFWNSFAKSSILTIEKVTVVSRGTDWCPDIRIKTESSGYKIVNRVKGTQELILALEAEDNRLRFGKSGAWKNLTVFRNGINLGTLAKIREDYHFWMNEMDAWAIRTGSRRRNRRAPRGSNLKWQDGDFYEVLADGSLKRLDDASQLNPVSAYNKSGQ